MHLFLYSMPELRQLLVLRQNTHNSSLNAEQLNSSRPLMLSHRAHCRLLVCSLACSPRKQFIFFSSHLKPPRTESLFHVSLWFCFLFHWESTTFKNNIQHTDRHSKQLFKAPVLTSTCLHAVTYSHIFILPFLLLLWINCAPKSSPSTWAYYLILSHILKPITPGISCFLFYYHFSSLLNHPHQYTSMLLFLFAKLLRSIV